MSSSIGLALPFGHPGRCWRLYPPSCSPSTKSLANAVALSRPCGGAPDDPILPSRDWSLGRARFNRRSSIRARPEPQDEQEDPAQDNEADGERRPVAEALGEVVPDDDRNDDVHHRDDVQKDPP